MDDAPDQEKEPAGSPWADLLRDKRTIARDLELILNTRCSLLQQEDLEHYPLSRQSILSFGVMDFSSLSLKNPDDQARLQDGICQAIEAFEPRLDRIRIRLDRERSATRMLHFRVDAVMRQHSDSPSVSFDAQLQVASGTYQVKH